MNYYFIINVVLTLLINKLFFKKIKLSPNTSDSLLMGFFISLLGVFLYFIVFFL